VPFSFATLLGILIAAAPGANAYPGFSCMTLAHRQSLPSAPGVTFRVLKQTYAPTFAAVKHRHKFGEILAKRSSRAIARS
jgi:hypothetical protein